ncbi:hypothetical protein RIF29_29575 [Crotalaria pallida]|uniref:Uncharacterized protein n=1 Tax=Crotalaria pallida TaxID=3830 RepID=A0AAN9EK05_CROPI
MALATNVFDMNVLYSFKITNIESEFTVPIPHDFIEKFHDDLGQLWTIHTICGRRWRMKTWHFRTYTRSDGNDPCFLLHRASPVHHRQRTPPPLVDYTYMALQQYVDYDPMFNYQAQRFGHEIGGHWVVRCPDGEVVRLLYEIREFDEGYVGGPVWEDLRLRFGIGDGDIVDFYYLGNQRFTFTLNLWDENYYPSLT